MLLPKYNFIEELRWRNMVHDIMPGTEELLNKQIVTGYIGFDPTADSLGVGNLVQVMMLLHFQKAIDPQRAPGRKTERWRACRSHERPG